MNKTLIAGIVGIVLLAGLVIGVQAYGPGAQSATNTGCQYHEQMQQVLATGTYADLVKLREQSGKPMMPFVTDDQTFQEAKDRHAQMVAQYGSDAPQGAGCGKMNAHTGRGAGRGNCPMNQ